MSSLNSEAEKAGMRLTLDSHRPARVAIQRNTPVDDGQGGATDSWATVATVNAYIEEQTSRGERSEGGKVVSVSLWVIEVAWGTVVTPTDRLVSGGSTYEVLTVDTDDSEELAVYCTCRKAV